MLVLSDEQLMLRDAVSGFFAASAPVSQLRRLRDNGDATGYDADTWREMTDLGLLGVLVPEELGGTDFGHVGLAVICEAMGRNLTSSPYISSAVLSVATLCECGSPEQLSAWLPAIVQGESIWAIGAQEFTQSERSSAEIAATHRDGAFALTGTAMNVADAHVANFLILIGRTSGSQGDACGLSLFIVDPEQQGVEILPQQNIDSRVISQVTLSDVQVIDGNLLGQLDAANEILHRPIRAGRLALAAELLGIAREVFKRTLTYLKERQQFGRAIGSFQALQHRAATLYCELEVLESTVLAAAQACDVGENTNAADELAALAKLKAIHVSRLAVCEAVQFHGGMGMTDEVDIGLFLKRARSVAEYLGGESVLANCVGVARGF